MSDPLEINSVNSAVEILLEFCKTLGPASRLVSNRNQVSLSVRPHFGSDTQNGIVIRTILAREFEKLRNKH